MFILKVTNFDLKRLDMNKVNQDPSDKETEKTNVPAEEDRQTWSKQIEFLLACVGYSVGLVFSYFKFSQFV